MIKQSDWFHYETCDFIAGLKYRSDTTRIVEGDGFSVYLLPLGMPIIELYIEEIKRGGQE